MKKSKKRQIEEEYVPTEPVPEEETYYPYDEQPRLRFVTFAPAKRISRFVAPVQPHEERTVFDESEYPPKEDSVFNRFEPSAEEFAEPEKVKKSKRKKKSEEPVPADDEQPAKPKKSVAKRVFATIGIILLVAVVGFGAFLTAACFGYGKHIKTAATYKPVVTRDVELELVDGYWTFTLPEGDEAPFKVLQLTDLHIGGGIVSSSTDQKALDAIYRLVAATKPDLIILTGDLVYPNPLISGSFDNLKSAKIVGTLMETIGIPWTLTYGNHDCEKYALHDKSEISAYYSGLKNCLFQKGYAFEKTENSPFAPEGNTFINVLNSDGTHNTSFVLFDSNMYVGSAFGSKYDVIHKDQVDWYERELIKLSTKYTGGSIEDLKTLAFFHIPCNEYKDAWAQYAGGKNEMYLGGDCGEKDYTICAPFYDGTIFDKMVELGSTRGIFCGHDHLNTWSLDYKDIVLTYGMSIDYLAYANIRFKGLTDQRGGTVITLEAWNAANDKTYDFKIQKLKLTDVK